MSGVVRIYTFIATPDAKADQAGIVKTMVEIGALLSRHNKKITNVTIRTAGPTVEIELTMTGHDQWAVKKNIIYPITTLLHRAGLKVDQARLASVDKPPDPRGGYRSPHPDVMIPHDDMMQGPPD